jgi:hypothetical protein
MAQIEARRGLEARLGDEVAASADGWEGVSDNPGTSARSLFSRAKLNASEKTSTKKYSIVKDQK